MAKRYYCDFCDKSFPYSVEGRKKHRNGYHHQQQQKVHYNQFKSASERLEEERTRERCQIFYSGQECRFGDNCKYSHLTQADLATLQQQAFEEEERKRIARLPTQMKGEHEPSLESWFAAREKEETSASQPTIEDLRTLWQMTPEAASSLHSLLPSLPPSLIPPQPSSEWLASTYSDWG